MRLAEQYIYSEDEYIFLEDEENVDFFDIVEIAPTEEEKLIKKQEIENFILKFIDDPDVVVYILNTISGLTWKEMKNFKIKLKDYNKAARRFSSKFKWY